MATLTVGTGQQFSTIAAAVAASRDGDVLAVQAGTYTNDFAAINTSITLQAVGGRVTMAATVAPPNGKAILITRNDITIDGFEFTGTKVPDGNGAGIRFEGGNLTILNSHFHHNENGLLCGTYPDGTITIRNSEFDHNGIGDGRTHNLYVGQVGTLTVEDSYFHDAVVGHEIKSRAYTNIIRNNRIQNEEGNASYEIDLPNGGNAVVTGNVIQQGAQSQNPAIIHYGGEGTPYAGSSLEISGNTVINQLVQYSTRVLLNETSYTATITGNAVYGLNDTQIAIGPATISGTTYLASLPVLDTSSPWETDGPGTPGPDNMMLAEAVNGVTIDLGAGADRLVLSSAGPNLLTVIDVENLIGGSLADRVTLGSAMPAGRVDLRGGEDRLVLSSAGPNALTVFNVETMLGGSDDDSIRLGTAATGATINLGGGTDRLRLHTASANEVTVAGVESVAGGQFADRITVLGGVAAVVDGGAGADTITGGNGADRLIGGAGPDQMTGGAGADRFLFRATNESPLGAPDQITDFQAGVDDLVMVGLLQGSFAWRGGAAFTGSGNSEARLAGTTLQVDADGNGSAEMAVLLAGGSLAGMSAADFIWS